MKFQPALADVLFDIGRLDAVLARQRRFLASSTRNRDETMRAAMRRLTNKRERLMELANIGRSLGDAFAWFFYQYDLALLQAHAKRPRPPMMNSGVGGQSEWRLAKGLQVSDHQFVIHHCLTSILRLGDMSLWDAETRRITAIGETKSGIPEGTSVRVQVEYVFRADAVRRRLATPPAAAGDATAREPLVFPRTEADRRARQIRSLESAITSAVNRTAEHVETEAETHIKEFEASASRARDQSGIEWTDAGPGLLILTFQSQKPTTPESIIPPGKPTEEFVQRTSNLIRAGSRFNSLVIGSLVYERRGSPIHVLGMRPFFWEMKDAAVLSDLLLKRLAAIVLFNPAHLIEELEKDGFTVERHRAPLEFLLTRWLGKRKLELRKFDFFAQLRMHCLFTHESVLQMVRSSVRASEAAAARHDGPTAIDLQFGSPLIPPGHVSSDSK